MANLSITASVNCKRKSKDWHCRTDNSDLLNLHENKFDYKEIRLRKKNFSGILKSEICTKWEKFRRAQELRADEVSVQKLRENHETFQQLFPIAANARTNESMSDSGEFQEVESNSS